MNHGRNIDSLSRVTLSGTLSLAEREILTPGAMEFLVALEKQFGDRRRKLVARRSIVQREIDLGAFPDFDDSPGSVRAGSWYVRTAPADLLDRRVEVTVPAGDPVQVLEGLNSGANVCVLDFEDSLSPGWAAVISGQRAVAAASKRELTAFSPEGRKHTLAGATAVAMVRPRGWHLTEKHFCVDGEPVSASLFDAGLYLFLNAKELLGRGSGPYLSLPKLENRYEAGLWNDVLGFAEEHLGIAPRSIRVSALIETILAAFEMDEILYELRERSLGLGCDHRDTMFSVVKKFSKYRDCLLSDAGAERSEGGLFGALETLLIQTCHRRGTFAVGPAPSSIPSPGDSASRDAVRQAVSADIEAALRAGFDGMSVAYPALVGVAREVCDPFLPCGHQLGTMRAGENVTREDLLSLPRGSVSESALRSGIDLAVRYLESWLSGTGSVPLRGRLEDAAGAELARASIWQWMSRGVRLEEGPVLTPEHFRRVFSEEMGRISEIVGPERYRRGQFELASRLFFNIIHDADFPAFITPRAYQHL